MDNREHTGQREIIFVHSLTILGLALETHRGGLHHAKIVSNSRKRLLCFKFTAFDDCFVGETKIAAGGNSYWVSGLDCSQCNGSCAAGVKRKCDCYDRQDPAGDEIPVVLHDASDLFELYLIEACENEGGEWQLHKYSRLSGKAFEGVFQRRAGYLEHPLERATHVQNQENPAGDRQRAHKHYDVHCDIAGSEQAKGDK